MEQNSSAAKGLTAVAIVFFIISIICLIANCYLIYTDSPARSIALTRSLFLATVTIGFLFGLLSIIRIVQMIFGNSESVVGDMRLIRTGITQQEALLTRINENLLLSDAIKSVAFREKDREVLQMAIKTDMRKEMWHSAEMLINELEKNFASPEEARKLREEMEKYRNASIQEKIENSLKNIEALWMIHHYEEAHNQIEILKKLYPENETVRSLEGKTEQLKQEHKKTLLDRWDRAVKNNDYEQGVEILKLLDDYLTASEAAALEESARGVFRAKLHNMGVQFSLCVTNKDWNQAVKIGNQIIREYPNSRMAQEVRSKKDILQKRAEEQKKQKS